MSSSGLTMPPKMTCSPIAARVTAVVSRRRSRGGRPRRSGHGRPPPRSGPRLRAPHDLANPAVRLDAVLGVEAGRNLKHRDVGERIAGRGNRVRQPSLLADLVEEARARGAAQEGGVDREAPRGCRGSLTSMARPVTQAQVRLLRFPRLDERARRRAGAGSGGSGGATSGKRPMSSSSRPSVASAAGSPTRKTPRLSRPPTRGRGSQDLVAIEPRRFAPPCRGPSARADGRRRSRGEEVVDQHRGWSCARAIS